MPRDEFPKQLVQTLAKRVNSHCSHCNRSTSGPTDDPLRAVNLGKAAHITAAAPGGPRYNPTLTSDQRKAIENAIWLCSNCAKLVDDDVDQYPVEHLVDIKRRAESRAAIALGASSEFRAIAPTEIRCEWSTAEMCAFARLEKEFACRIEKDIHVRAGNTWIRLSGAVVRGEELIAIDIHENHGDGIAYFQIKYLLEECLKLTFDRFQKCTAHLVVVSDGPEDRDAPVEAKLKKMLAEFSIDGQVRMFRLNKLRAEFSL